MDSCHSSDENLVWHYTTAAALHDVVTHNRIWATSAAFVNDAEEMRTGRIALLELFERRKDSLSPRLQERFRQSGLLSTSGVVENYLLSASTSGDLLTMWRNYGGSEVPYSIGLERDHSLRPLEQVSGNDHPNPPHAYYDDARIDLGGGEYASNNPDIPIAEGGKWTDVYYIEGSDDKVLTELFGDLITQLDGVKKSYFIFPTFLFPGAPSNYLKHAGFRDEREVRAIWWLNPSWKFVKHRPSRFGLVPYIEVAAVPPETEIATATSTLPIRAITIGPTPFRNDAEASLRILLDNSGYGAVEIRQSITPFR